MAVIVHAAAFVDGGIDAGNVVEAFDVAKAVGGEGSGGGLTEILAGQ